MSLIETTADVFAPVPDAVDRIAPEGSDIGLVNALAAYQLAYGKEYEALALLTISRRYRPDDEQTLRLLVQAFIQLEDWDKAEAMLRELERVSPRRRPTARMLLARSVILLRRFRIEEGRRLFAEFMNRIKKG